jgi:hypothetical protein
MRDHASKEVVLKSLATVGHEVVAGKASIVGENNKPIPAKEMLVRHGRGGRPVMLRVIDPGPQYPVCFDPSAPGGHLAMVEKVQDKDTRT